MNSNKEKPLELAAGDENRKITRHVLDCLGKWPDLPVKSVTYGMLQPDKAGISLISLQGAVITKRYITGGHQAEYPFALIYRIKPGNSIDKRLAADELLDSLGDWAVTQCPDLEGAIPMGFQITERASPAATYSNGDEDHQIVMKFIYEVI